MKRIANRLLLFTAAALSLGTAAYGQILVADVPFAFQTHGTVSTAGQYTVKLEPSGTGKIVHIFNSGTHQSLMSVAYSLNDRPLATVTPHLVFRCGEKSCALSEIWTASGAYAVPQSRVRRNPEYLASVPLASGK
jgi:hypothetical protein